MNVQKLITEMIMELASRTRVIWTTAILTVDPLEKITDLLLKILRNTVLKSVLIIKSPGRIDEVQHHEQTNTVKPVHTDQIENRFLQESYKPDRNQRDK